MRASSDLLEMGRYYVFDFDTIFGKYRDIDIDINEKISWVKYGRRPIVYSHMTSIDC